MARVSKEFAANFDLVTSTWIARGEHSAKEIEQLRQVLRVELSSGPGVPHPRINGELVMGWKPRSHEDRVKAYELAFSDWAAEIRRDEARSARIKAEIQAWKEKVAA